MDTFSNIDRFLSRIPDGMRRYGGRLPAPDPGAPAIREPDLTDAEVHPFSRLLTADELEALTSIKKTWWLAEAREDRIPHLRAGKYVRFEFLVIVQFLRERSASLREQRQ